MSAFVFKLEAVLRHRRQGERQKQRAMAAIQLELTQCQEALRRMQQEVQQSAVDLIEARAGGEVPAAIFGLHGRFLQSARARRSEILRQIEDSNQCLIKARRELNEAISQRKSIERLRENQRQQWLLHQRRRESELLDEVAGQMSCEKEQLGA